MSVDRERGSRHSSAVLESLAQESYDMITLLPTYIENTRRVYNNLPVIHAFPSSGLLGRGGGGGEKRGTD